MGSCESRLNHWLSYTTVKLVDIHNWKLGGFHYLVQLLILVYVLVYVVWYDNGYQGVSQVVGQVSIKPKGSALQSVPGQPPLVWDATDIVIPFVESNAIFITTNSLTTPLQMRGNWSDPDQPCVSNQNCSISEFTEFGPNTGTCLPSGFCEVYSWGPIESSLSAPAILTQVQNMTLFIRATAFFPKYDKIINNIGDALQPGRNLFTVSDIVKASGYSFNQVAQNGTIIACTVAWNCDFDFWSGACLPVFSFVRLDDPAQKFSTGYNYRYANYYRQLNATSGEQTEYRDLFKVYGIRVVFISNGLGRRFDIVPLLVNIGSGLGLLTFATILSDMVVLYFVPQRKKYKSAKFQDVGDSVRDYSDIPDSVEQEDIIEVENGEAGKARSTEYSPLHR